MGRKVSLISTLLIVSALFSNLVIAIAEFAAKPLSEFTSAEIDAIRKLRSLVVDSLDEDYMKDDYYLIRFLRARYLNVQAAEDMLLLSLAWRKREHIQNITQESLEVEKLLPYSMSYDRKFQPLAVLRIGKWKIRQLMISGRRDDLVRSIYKSYELIMLKIVEAANATGQKITQAVEIIDLTGYNAREHTCPICIPVYFDLFSTYENYYPRMYSKIVLINTPRIFGSVWQILKPALSQFTQNSVTIYGFAKQEWKAELLKIAAKDQLPWNLGGTLRS